MESKDAFVERKCAAVEGLLVVEEVNVGSKVVTPPCTPALSRTIGWDFTK
jgi:hypothetical protein